MLYKFYVMFGGFIISGPFLAIGCLALIFREVGWIGIVGIGVMIVSGIMAFIVSGFTKKVRGD